MNRIIDVSDITNTLWNHTKLIGLYNFLEKSDEKTYKRMFYNTLFTKHIQQYLNELIKIENEMILKIYWEEFKLFRGMFLEKYLNAKQTKIDQRIHLDEHLTKLLQQEISFDDNYTLLQHMEMYINENRKKQNTQCKICYDNLVSHVIVHEEHTCTICLSCTDQIRRTATTTQTMKCPFCKLDILDTKKLFIR